MSEVLADQRAGKLAFRPAGPLPRLRFKHLSSASAPFLAVMGLILATSSAAGGTGNGEGGMEVKGLMGIQSTKVHCHSVTCPLP